MRFGLLALLLVISPYHAVAEPLEDKAAADRLESLFADILGPGKARVFIHSREIPLPASGVSPHEEGEVLWDRWQNRIDSLPPVLPGYRVPRALKEELQKTLREEAAAARPQTRTLRTVRIVLTSDISEADAERVRILARNSLELDAVKGDILRLSRAPQAAAPQGFPLQRKFLDAALYAATASVILIVAYFLFTPRKRPGRSQAPPTLEAFENPDRPPCLAMLAPHHVKAAAKFLDRQPLADTLYVLKTTTLPVAAELFCRLSPAKRRAAAQDLMFSPAESLPPEEPIEARLLLAVSAHEGGEGLLERILQRSPERIRREVLSRLFSRAPARVRRLKQTLVTLEALATAPSHSLRTCLASFSCEDITLALFDAPEKIRAALIDALPEVVRDIVRDRGEHFVPESYEQVFRARADLFSRWRRLEVHGRVQPLHPVSSR